MFRIREAVPDDLDRIMQIERETFGALGPDAMATRQAMEERIGLLKCLPDELSWFLVAERVSKDAREVVGDIIMQPTNLDPSECTSWETATDCGTLQRTFNPHGKHLFAVSLAVSPKAPPGTADMLIHTALALRLHTRKECFMFCSRMPGFEQAHLQSGISPEDYWQAKRPDGSPKDWMLRQYASTFGERPTRLLRDGFPPDKDSGGHGVLFVTTQAVTALVCTALRIYRAGRVSK